MYGLCSSLLPELAANDITRLVQFLRMVIHTFEELFDITEPMITKNTTKFRLYNHELVSVSSFTLS